MALSLQSFGTMIENMAAGVQGACSSLIDFTVGSPLRAILQATGSVGLWLQYLVLAVLQRQRLSTSVGTQCDTFVADFPSFGGRLAAVASSGLATFSRFSPVAAALIPVGGQVRTADGTQTFTVTTNTSNSLWNADQNGYLIPAASASGTVPIQAVNAGAQGNIIAGAINLILGAISGVDTVTNAVAIANGVNAETDPALKARFYNFIATRGECTSAAITYAIQSVGLNITSTLAEFLNPALVYTPGYFTAYIDDGSGNPPSTTIQSVSSSVDGVRACGIQYAVLGPSEVIANVSFTLTVASNIVKSSILAVVETAVATYISTLAMGQALSYSRLAQVIYDSTPGITNVTSLLLNGATSDIGGTASQVVRAGGVTAS